jgi:solute carrier family 25 oxoglutarate transporter 11
MSSGLIYSLATMPLESAKNRMAFQKPDAQGVLPYRTTVQTVTSVAKAEGVLSLWNGFLPYYGRCGGHTVAMFVALEQIRGFYSNFLKK